jgi:hypothetical protein
MTNHVVRLYTAAGTIVAFFLLWATIAAHPWATTEQVTPQDPRLVALARREKGLRKHAVVVNRAVARRWAAYERRSERRQSQNAAALQRHIQELEASQAAAISTARRALADAARARAYAVSVVAWADAQLGSTGGAVTAPRGAPAPQAFAKAGSQIPAASGAPAPQASAKAGSQIPAARAPLPKAPAPPAAPQAPSAPVSAPAPPATPAPAPAQAQAPAAAPPPPVQVVALPPVTTTKPSKKG